MSIVHRFVFVFLLTLIPLSILVGANTPVAAVESDRVASDSLGGPAGRAVQRGAPAERIQWTLPGFLGLDPVGISI